MQSATEGLEVSDLIKRILSGCLVIGIVAAMIGFQFIFPYSLNIIMALITATAVFELVSAVGLRKHVTFILPSVAFALAIPLIPNQLYWSMVTYFLYTISILGSTIYHYKKVKFQDICVVFGMTLLVTTSLNTVSLMRYLNPQHCMLYVVMALFAAWIADAGAYFVGSFIGKHKLCPNISPKKTVEGAVGGFIINIGLIMLMGYLYNLIFYGSQLTVSYLALAIIGGVTAILSIVGDLSFSIIKRSYDVKDFGNLIPGHGGMMDRFDSVVIVGPFIYLFIQLLPVIQ